MNLSGNYRKSVLMEGEITGEFSVRQKWRRRLIAPFFSVNDVTPPPFLFQKKNISLFREKNSLHVNLVESRL